MRRWGIVFFILVFLWSCGGIIRQEHEAYRPQAISRTGIVKSAVNSRTGIVKNIVKKKMTTEYWFDDFLAVKMNKGSYSKYIGSRKDGHNRIEKYKQNYMKKYKRDDIEIGDRVAVYGKGQDLDNFIINDFDYGRHLKSKGLDHYIRISRIEKLSYSPFYRTIGRVKSYIVEANRMMYKTNSGLLNAILVADKSGLSDEDRYIFSDSGTSHVMAVSGLHVGIICVILLVFIGKINNLKRLALLFIVLMFYNLLVGGGPSITRAIVLTLLTCLGFFVYRQVDGINLLFIIAGFMVLENPYSIYNISFQLSFLAMVSILVFTKYIKKYVYSDILAASIGANILTVPVVLYTFKSTSTVGLAGNLLVIPLIAGIVCMDIFSLALYYFGIPLYSLLAVLNSSIIDLLMLVLKKIGNFGVNNIEIRNPRLDLVLIYYVFVIILILYLDYYYIHKNKYQPNHLDPMEK